jgi:hypothetical protein
VPSAWGAVIDSVFAIATLITWGVLLGEFLRVPFDGLLGFDLGYFAFPFFILASFLLVYAHSWPLIRVAWTRRRVRWASWLAGGGFAVFYIFATNMVSAPDPGAPPPSYGFFVASQVYSQMALWPDVEFWFPRIGLFGYFSVGSVLLVVSLGLLASFAVALLLHGIQLRKEEMPGTGAIGSFGAAFITSLWVNSCCCCAPVLLPLAALLVGEGTATSLQYYLFVPGPFQDLLAVANIASLLLSVLLSTRGMACHVLGERDSTEVA